MPERIEIGDLIEVCAHPVPYQMRVTSVHEELHTRSISRIGGVVHLDVPEHVERTYGGHCPTCAAKMGVSDQEATIKIVEKGQNNASVE